MQPPTAIAETIPAQATLEVHELVCGYQKKPVLGPFNFELHAGDFLLIEGPNGIGKSTLIKTLIGLIPAVSGDFHWSTSQEARRFVPQTRTLDPMLPATVFDVLATGLQQGGRWRSLRVKIDRPRFEEVLKIVDLPGLGHRLFRELSEGQKQLVLLGRALLGEPQVLLLDEPTASMDPARESMVIELLQDLRAKKNTTIIMIAHGNDLAQNASSHRLKISRKGELEFIQQSLSPL